MVLHIKIEKVKKYSVIHRPQLSYAEKEKSFKNIEIQKRNLKKSLLLV